MLGGCYGNPYIPHQRADLHSPYLTVHRYLDGSGVPPRRLECATYPGSTYDKKGSGGGYFHHK